MMIWKMFQMKNIKYNMNYTIINIFTKIKNYIFTYLLIFLKIILNLFILKNNYKK